MRWPVNAGWAPSGKTRDMSRSWIRRVFDRDDSEPLPEWKQRLDQARQQLESMEQTDGVMLGQIEGAEREIELAIAARDDVSSILATLDRDEVERDLKVALRNRSQLADESDRRAGHDRLVVSLQRRRETLHQLYDRQEQLDLAIETSLVEIEDLVAQHAEFRSLAPSLRAEVLSEQVDHLRIDLAALRQAHTEVDEL